MNYSLVSVRNIEKERLEGFDCSVDVLNLFLKRYSLKNDLLGIGKTFVAESESGKVCGYFTLSSAQIKFEEMPLSLQTGIPKYPIPAIRIARLATDKKIQGTGCGKWLMKQALLKILQVADIAAVHVVLVDAKESAESFYEQFGLQRLKDSSFFLPVATVLKAINKESSQ